MKIARPNASVDHPVRRQRGVTTLAVTLLLLVIITIIVLFSTNVAFFEQRTAQNQSRARIAEQAAEYALNLSGEFLKSNIANIVTTGSGWLGSGTTRRWTLCSSVSSMAADHPCMAEALPARRNNLYFYNFNSSTALPYTTLGGALTAAGGAAGSTFPVTTTVNALLCRLDTTLVNGSGVSAPDCRAIPASTSANRIAVTLIANVRMDDENAVAQVKETWASYNQSSGFSAVPLVAAGTVQGLGNAQIVAAPNGAGFGLPVSIWSPCPVDIEKSAGQVTPAGCQANNPGIGSVSTCQLGEFLGSVPVAELKTTCASGNSCGCPNNATDSMSGHLGGGLTREGADILDFDGNAGTNAQGLPIPDIQFFPGRGLDDDTDPLDDSLFEWIFGQDVVAEATNPSYNTTVQSNCGPSSNENCALVALRDNLGATVLSSCDSLGPTSSGLFYVDGDCALPNQVGSATSPAIVVVNGDHPDNGGNQGVRLGSDFFGLLFVRSDNNSAKLKGNGGRIFGSVSVEGAVDLAGNIRIIYDNTTTGGLNSALPANTRFAKVTGSWLDRAGGF